MKQIFSILMVLIMGWLLLAAAVSQTTALEAHPMIPGITGYPALMLTDTSFLRNPNYHHATDTADTLDYPRMTEVTLGVASAMRKLLG